MSAGELLVRVRGAAGLSQEALARAAGTSRSTLSAYEGGHKSPRLDTVERLLAAAGFVISFEPQVRFAEVVCGNRTITVPDRLPRLPLGQALAEVVLPVHLNWSAPDRIFALGDRRQRARVYEIVLREGTAADILRYVDGVLLLDLWDELVLPRRVRQAWANVVVAPRSRPSNIRVGDLGTGADRWVAG